MSQKPKIIIVDDEPDVAEVLVVFLDDYFDCEICFAGRDALELIEKYCYDALITDLEMPDFSGLQLIRQAKIIRPDMKVFVSTGHGGDHPLVRKAFAIGVHNSLQKPFLDPDYLVSCIRNELPAAPGKRRSPERDEHRGELR